MEMRADDKRVDVRAEVQADYEAQLQKKAKAMERLDAEIKFTKAKLIEMIEEYEKMDEELFTMVLHGGPDEDE